jgi:hypothetical protein
MWSMTSSLLGENLLERHVLGSCRALEFMMNDQVLRERGSQFRRRSSCGHQYSVVILAAGKLIFK